MLDAAERSTDALQEAAGRRALHIVNQCGRQRMRVQRIAKESLRPRRCCARATPPRRSRRAGRALDAFEAAQRELERTPLRSPEIRQALAAMRDEWLRLLGGVRAAGTADGPPRAGARERDDARAAGLATAAYEHSLQVIMG